MSKNYVKNVKNSACNDNLKDKRQKRSTYIP